MFNLREIVLVPFPFSDLSAIKKRPVLIVLSNQYNSIFPDILVCVITSNLYLDDFSVGLTNVDLENGILPEQSVIKCHKLFSISQTKILKKFSKITEERFDEVIQKLKKLIQTSE